MKSKQALSAGIAAAFVALSMLPAAAKELKVVASFSILGDLVEQVRCACCSRG